MIWLILSVVSLVLTLGFSFVFVFFALILLSGYMSMKAAMSPYLFFNCLVWPVMVSVTTAVSWLIVTVAKRPIPLVQLGVLNAAIVTLCLAAIAAFLYFS